MQMQGGVHSDFLLHVDRFHNVGFFPDLLYLYRFLNLYVLLDSRMFFICIGLLDLYCICLCCPLGFICLYGTLNFICLYMFEIDLFDFWCLTPLSARFQLYHGDQFQWWKKPEYPERTTDHVQATDQLYHLRLRVQCILFM